METLWSLYNKKVKPFENEDDVYKAKADALYGKYSDLRERLSDGFEDSVQKNRSELTGFGTAMKDIVGGLLVGTVENVAFMGATQVYLHSKPFGVTPDWVSGFVEHGSIAGLMPEELVGFEKVDAQLALKNVDYDDLLELRKSIGEGVAGADVGSADDIYKSINPLDSEKLPVDLEGVNPYYVKNGGAGVNVNCGSCANTGYMRLMGKDPTAVAENVKYCTPNYLAPSAQLGFHKPAPVEVVIDMVMAEPDGFTTSIIIHQGSNVQHAINVTKINGKVIFIDAQMGKIIELNPDLLIELGKTIDFD